MLIFFALFNALVADFLVAYIYGVLYGHERSWKEPLGPFVD